MNAAILLVLPNTGSRRFQICGDDAIGNLSGALPLYEMVG